MMMDDYSGYGHMMNFGYGGGLFAMLLMVVLATLITVLFLRYFRGQHNTSAGEATALELLNRRYAKGDLSKDEYHLMKDDIK